MRTFKDRTGREWTVDLNITAVKRAKALIGVDILDLMDETKGTDLLTRIQGNEVLMVDLVYVLIKPEADAKGITDEDFGGSMAGESIDAAYMVLLAEICDFFRNPARRAVLRTALQKLSDLEGRAIKRAEAILASGEPERIAEVLMDRGIPSGSSPASSASTPGL